LFNIVVSIVHLLQSYNIVIMMRDDELLNKN